MERNSAKKWSLTEQFFNQGGGNQFLRSLQELSLWVLSETAAAAFCSELFSHLRNGSERNSELFSLPLKGSEGNSESLLLFLFRGTEFRVVFSSLEGFGREFQEFASISVPRNGIPRCFLFRGRVRNGIPRNSVPRNSRNSVGNNHLFRQFRLPRNYFFVGNSQP
jgi:hypothetical protein